MIRNIALDLGGVVIALDQTQAVKAFERLGLKDAARRLDPYRQSGIFGELEEGAITAEDFRRELSILTGRELTLDECYQGWHAYVSDLPERNLQAIIRLRSMGYKVCLLSNTNPFMMQWARSTDFDGKGNSIDHYFDRLYTSYECKAMKPSPEIFRMMLEGQEALPEETLFVDDSIRNVQTAEALGIHTVCPKTNADWTEDVFQELRSLRS